jgi:hypothetical protein
MFGEGLSHSGGFEAPRIKGLRHQRLVTQEKQIIGDVERHQLALHQRLRLERPQRADINRMFLHSVGTARPEQEVLAIGQEVGPTVAIFSARDIQFRGWLGGAARCRYAQERI